MFLLVRSRLTAITILCVLLAVPAAALARAPTRKQIADAVRRAERSRYLWATFNICNTMRHPNAVGIRAQMPALGFRARMSMRFQVTYLSAKDRRFKPVPGAARSVALASASNGLYQAGVTFRFAPNAGLLSSTVSFTWALGRRSLGQVTRATSGGHRDADAGDPPHFSAGKCMIR